jgi:hypothetical protein
MSFVSIYPIHTTDSYTRFIYPILYVMQTLNLLRILGDLETTGLILHEIGHEFGNHTEHGYDEALTGTAGRMVFQNSFARLACAAALAWRAYLEDIWRIY